MQKIIQKKGGGGKGGKIVPAFLSSLKMENRASE